MPASRRNGTDLSGEPFTRIWPPADSRSSGFASSRSAAVAQSCVRASSAAALPPRPPALLGWDSLQPVVGAAVLAARLPHLALARCLQAFLQADAGVGGLVRH